MSQMDTTVKLSLQMRAVLTIVESDTYLKKVVMPFIDVENDRIDWEPILKNSFGSGHRAAMVWAYAIWTDEIKSKSNPFDAALSLSPVTQVAVLNALALRWGLK